MNNFSKMKVRWQIC